MILHLVCSRNLRYIESIESNSPQKLYYDKTKESEEIHTLRFDQK
jgi:hypothetical protein